MTLPFLSYIALGPLGWLAVLALAIFGRRRMNRLHKDRSPLADPPPSLSIVIPAKDEAAGIRDCIERVLRQDYPGARVVVIDDRSTDGTGEILDEIAAGQPRVGVFHVKSLPQGWLGKCHALYVGTRDVASEWLLFVDSDVGLAPDAARRAVALAAKREYDALSIMPRLDARSHWERTLLPLLATAWGAAFRISATNDDSRREHAFANGQFFLVRRSWYEQINGHEAVRDRIVEDVALMRVLKTAGARTRLMLGAQVAQTRMHTNLRQMFHGWARIFAGSSGRSTLPIACTLAAFMSSPVLLAWGIVMSVREGGWWTTALAAHAVLIVITVGSIYRWAGQSVVNVLFLPVSWPMTIAILSYALRVCFTGRVMWRGSSVTVNQP